MIRDAVAQYATRFHRLLDGTHSVASPFGAWLLLALVAPAATGATRARLTEVLGCDPDVAFAAASRMLRDPHAELVLGAAVWHDPEHATEPLLDFLRRVAAHANSGPIPTQAEADAWAQEHTLGLIDRFPIDIGGGAPLVVLLATAIATRVSWQVPFHLVPAELAQLPAASGFAGRPLLMDPGTDAWSGFLHTDAGLLAGFVARSTNGLLVASAMAAEGREPADVLDATQRLAGAVAAGRPPAALSLFDLELGDGPGWRISEGRGQGGSERYEMLVPAWEVASDHDLRAETLGFCAAGDALIALLPPDDYTVEAKQSAMARYTRVGFEAAAVTSLGVRAAAAIMRTPRRVRTARVEFTRPHAVVAATAGAGDWDGLPIFSAWVAEAVPAE